MNSGEQGPETTVEDAAGKTAVESKLKAPEGKFPLADRLERLEGFVYVGVAILFLVASVAMLIYTMYDFPRRVVDEGFAHAIIILINDLLLVVIILEILRTILGYLQSHVLSLQPFLVIAAISGTRRILTIGAAMAIGEDMTDEEFNRAIIDLGVNTVAVLVVAIAIFLTRTVGEHAQE